MSHSAARRGRVAGWLPDHDGLVSTGTDNMVNGREARPFELEILARVRAAAVAAEAKALLTGIGNNRKFNTDNGA